MITRSPLATMAKTPQGDGIPHRTNPTPWGFCIHTTGSGVPKTARDHGISPIEAALNYYCSPGANFPHYVIDSTGQIVQVADELIRARHAGIEFDDRMLYLSGDWRSRVDQPTLALWMAKWNKKSPLGLFPSKSPNEDYLGCELIPQLSTLPNGSLFTDEQYAALKGLIADVASRYGITLVGDRLVTHEDLEPLQRWNHQGGWDPGALRDDPTFLWGKIR